jgi:predicted transcriptional regulator YdeE
MAELVKFEVKALPPVRVVGKAIRVEMNMQENPIPAFWGKCFGDGTLKTLEDMTDQVYDPAYVGFMCRWGGSDGKFTYIVGMLMKEGTPVPDGYESEDISACEVAIGWIKGKEPDVYMASHQLTSAEMERLGLVMDESKGWCMELYNCPRFTVPDGNGDLILDYYIPCVVK